MVARPASGLLPEGVLAILAAVFGMALTDAIIKFSSAGITMWEIWVLRSVLVVPALLVLTRGRICVKGGVWVALRTFCLIMMYFCMYPALPFLDLALAGAAFYTAPFFIVGLTALVLDKTITLRHWLAICAGFAGLLMIVRPFGASFTPVIFLPVAAAAFYAVAAVITRSKCQSVSVGIQALWLNLAFLLLGSAASALLFGLGPDAVPANLPFLFGPWRAAGLAAWGVMALLAVLMLAIAIGVARAYQTPHPEIIATVEYAYMIFAVFWGYVFFGEVPDLWTLAGMALITAGGMGVIYVGQRAGDAQLPSGGDVGL